MALELPQAVVDEYIAKAVELRLDVAPTVEKWAMIEAARVSDSSWRPILADELRNAPKTVQSGSWSVRVGQQKQKGSSNNQLEEADRTLLEGWKVAVLKEIRLALCAANSRYQKEVKELASNGRLLIGAIAGYVASSVGVAVAVIAALVAALLRLVLMIGVRAWCEATKP